MRVSLTADPVEEVIFAKELLAATGIRKDRIEIVSCPTCGRTEVDLQVIAGEIERRVELLQDRGVRDLKIAVMGCAVNGPGEAKEADLGIAGGNGVGILMKKGEIIKKVPEEELLKALEYELKNWSE